MRRMIRFPFVYVACMTALGLFIGCVGWAFWALFTALLAA
jgi:hypothetical protein